MTLVLNGKGLLLEGSNPKIEDKQVPGIYIYIYSGLIRHYRALLIFLHGFPPYSPWRCLSIEPGASCSTQRGPRLRRLERRIAQLRRELDSRRKSAVSPVQVVGCVFFQPAKVEQREPNPVDIPLYWLFKRNPYNGLL